MQNFPNHNELKGDGNGLCDFVEQFPVGHQFAFGLRGALGGGAVSRSISAFCS